MGIGVSENEKLPTAEQESQCNSSFGISAEFQAFQALQFSTGMWYFFYAITNFTFLIYISKTAGVSLLPFYKFPFCSYFRPK
jgi:hypothetical protein